MAASSSSVNPTSLAHVDNYIGTFVIPFDKLQKVLQEKLRALDIEDVFNGLFDFNSASTAPSGKILLQSRKQTKTTW
ncbi:hypothetical protein TNCV_3035461 [Trichonephila clavipes]|nr:hypothetical protein TNCV_3035461 [Trichonephila clavipes]